MPKLQNNDLHEMEKITTLPSQVRDVLNFVKLFFPLNELTNFQWAVMESLADTSREPLINQIVTYRLCQNVEHCAENGISMVVTRYLEVNPTTRQIVPLKTVRLIPTLHPLEMYLKSYTPITKL